MFRADIPLITVTFPFMAKGRNKSSYCQATIDTVCVKNAKCTRFVERSGSGVELRTLDYDNPCSNPGCGALGKFFHSTLLKFTQLNK